MSESENECKNGNGVMECYETKCYAGQLSLAVQQRVGECGAI